MKKNSTIQNIELRSKIYTLRQTQVMLDFDLAEIYGYEVRTLNQQVRRNIARFPEDFMFQLTREEVESVKSQFVTLRQNADFQDIEILKSNNATSNKADFVKSQNVISPQIIDSQYSDRVMSQFANTTKDSLFAGQEGGTRKLPYAFTEQGVYMLATVLRGTLAEQQSIYIMRAFRELKHYMRENLQFVTRNEMQLLTNSLLTISQQNISLKEKQEKTETEIKRIYESIDKINENFVQEIDFKNFVIYKGEKFEADVAYTDIYKLANQSIYVIDNYVDIKTLELLKHKKRNVNVILFTQNIHSRNGFLTNAEVADFNAQYPQLTLKPNPDCHDRFIIIDYKSAYEKVFHCGASSKDAGKNICAINQFENTALLYPIIDKYLTFNDILNL